MERWQRPARILDIEEEPTMVLESGDGRRWGVPRITVDEETKERIRLGYMCALCFQPFEQAWPITCSFCGARVRDGQGDYFARMDKGAVELKSGFNTDEEIELMHELLEREREGRDGS